MPTRGKKIAEFLSFWKKDFEKQNMNGILNTVRKFNSVSTTLNYPLFPLNFPSLMKSIEQTVITELDYGFTQVVGLFFMNCGWCSDCFATFVPSFSSGF